MASIKRLAGELHSYLIPTFTTVDVVYEQRETTIRFNNIKIILTQDYPFRSPIVFINERPYRFFLLPPHSQRINTIIHGENIKCLCCNSLVKNPDLWSPIYTIKDILEEIKRVTQIKHKIKYTMATEDICAAFEKRLNQNIDKHIEFSIMNFLQ
jgi:ubiquitin-protein ligase